MPAGHAPDDALSRFQPLLDRLAACEADELVLPFAQVAALLGRRSLPESAVLQTNWWTNKNLGQVRAWRALGWRAIADRDNLRVRFIRDAPQSG
jgi:hypothetical protein